MTDNGYEGKSQMKNFFPLLSLLFSALLAEPYQSDEFLLPGWAITSGMGGIRIVHDWAGLSAAINPALLSNVDALSFAASGGSFFQDLVTTVRCGAVFGTEKQKYGFAISHIGGGGIQITELANPEMPMSADNRPNVVDVASHYSVSLDIASSRMLKRISIGASVKCVRKKIPGASAWGFAFSTGALWKPIPPVDIALFAENISTYQLFWNDGVSETGLPRVGAGASYNFSIAPKITMTLATEGDYSFDSEMGTFRTGVSGTYSDVMSLSLGTDNGTMSTSASIEFGKIALGAVLNYKRSLGASYSFSIGYSPRINY